MTKSKHRNVGESDREKDKSKNKKSVSFDSNKEKEKKKEPSHHRKRKPYKAAMLNIKRQMNDTKTNLKVKPFQKMIRKILDVIIDLENPTIPGSPKAPKKFRVYKKARSILQLATEDYIVKFMGDCKLFANSSRKRLGVKSKDLEFIKGLKWRRFILPDKVRSELEPSW